MTKPTTKLLRKLWATVEQALYDAWHTGDLTIFYKILGLYAELYKASYAGNRKATSYGRMSHRKSVQ